MSEMDKGNPDKVNPDDEPESPALQAEITKPSRRISARWLIDWILKKQPRESTLIPAAEVEAETHLQWGSKELKFILLAAKGMLFRESRYEWKVRDWEDRASGAAGIYMLSQSERKKELYRRKRETLQRNQDIIDSARTIVVTELPPEERQEVEHAARYAGLLKEHAKKLMRDPFKPLGNGNENKKSKAIADESSKDEKKDEKGEPPSEK